MTEVIGDWVWQRAADLANADGSCWTAETIQSWSAGKAFARYIMQHETAPVDPLLIEAREIGAGVLDAQGLPLAATEVRGGCGDYYDAVRGALAALKSREKPNG